MSETVERLRASRLSLEAEEYSHGKNYGGKWAKKNAEYVELKRLSDVDFSDLEYESRCDPSYITEVITGGNYDHDLWEHEGLKRDPEFYRGFVEGALTHFENHREEIERAPTDP